MFFVFKIIIKNSKLYKAPTKNKAKMEQQIIKQSRVKRFIKETGRVMRILKKPSKIEFLGLLKITGLGITIIGAFGFIIFMLKQIF